MQTDLNMKSKHLLPILLAAFLGFIACSKTEEKKSSIALEPFSYSQIVQSSDSVAPGTEIYSYWNLSGQGLLPVFEEGNEGVHALRDSLECLARVRFADDGKAEARLDSDYKAILKGKAPAEAGSTCDYNLDIVLATPRVMVWKLSYYSYAYHAAHGMYGTSYLNYSLSQNKILSLSDILTGDYAKTLRKLLQNELSEKEDLMVSVDEIEIPKDWRLTTEGLEFSWQLYEIAPYSAGIITATVNAYDLEPLLTPAARSYFNFASE